MPPLRSGVPPLWSGECFGADRRQAPCDRAPARNRPRDAHRERAVVGGRGRQLNGPRVRVDARERRLHVVRAFARRGVEHRHGRREARQRRHVEGPEIRALFVRAVGERLNVQIRKPELRAARQLLRRHVDAVHGHEPDARVLVPGNDEPVPLARGQIRRRERAGERAAPGRDFVTRVEPVVRERQPEARAVHAAFERHAAAARGGEVPHDALAVRHEARIADAAHLQTLPPRGGTGLGLAHEQRAGHALPRAVAHVAPAPAAGERLHEQVVRHGAEPAAEVLGARGFQEPVGVELHEPARGGVLSAREQHGSVVQLQRLRLMDALVMLFAEPRAEFAEVARVADGIEDQFAEALPRLAVVVRNRGVQRVAVREHGLPLSGALARVQLRVVLEPERREHRGVVPDEQEPPVAQTEEVRHRVRLPERFVGLANAPRFAAVARFVERGVFAARAHRDPERAVLELAHGRFAAVRKPVRTLVAGTQARHARHGREIDALPGAAVVVGKAHGCVVASAAFLVAQDVAEHGHPALAGGERNHLAEFEVVPGHFDALGGDIARALFGPDERHGAHAGEVEPVAAPGALHHRAGIARVGDVDGPVLAVARGGIDALDAAVHLATAVVADFTIRRAAHVARGVDGRHARHARRRRAESAKKRKRNRKQNHVFHRDTPMGLQYSILERPTETRRSHPKIANSSSTSF